MIQNKLTEIINRNDTKLINRKKIDKNVKKSIHRNQLTEMIQNWLKEINNRNDTKLINRN